MARSSYYPYVLSRIQTATMANDRKQQVLGMLGQANSDELAVLFGLFNIRARWVLRTVGDPINEIFGGAHVVIRDNGSRYNDWKQLLSAKSRPSSHPSDGTQYHVDGPFIHTALFATLHGDTWVQLERHPAGLSHILGHIVDFFAYVSSHENPGPYGSSKYTDNRPIEVYPESYWRVQGDFPASGLGGSVG